MKFRRLDSSVSGLPCPAGHACPAVFETESGDFAVIGEDITDSSRRFLPDGASCGPDERIILVPKGVLTRVLSSIQEAKGGQP